MRLPLLVLAVVVVGCVGPVHQPVVTLGPYRPDPALLESAESLFLEHGYRLEHVDPHRGELFVRMNDQSMFGQATTYLRVQLYREGWVLLEVVGLPRAADDTFEATFELATEYRTLVEALNERLRRVPSEVTE